MNEAAFAEVPPRTPIIMFTTLECFVALVLVDARRVVSSGIGSSLHQTFTIRLTVSRSPTLPPFVYVRPSKLLVSVSIGLNTDRIDQWRWVNRRLADPNFRKESQDAFIGIDLYYACGIGFLPI
jgi:hypothetical protein